MKVENIRLCGKIFAVEVYGDKFTVTTSDFSKTAKIGEKIIL